MDMCAIASPLSLSRRTSLVEKTLSEISFIIDLLIVTLRETVERVDSIISLEIDKNEFSEYLCWLSSIKV
jgi:hypothetical protein